MKSFVTAAVLSLSLAVPAMAEVLNESAPAKTAPTAESARLVSEVAGSAQASSVIEAKVASSPSGTDRLNEASITSFDRSDDSEITNPTGVSLEMNQVTPGAEKGVESSPAAANAAVNEKVVRPSQESAPVGMSADELNSPQPTGAAINESTGKSLSN